MGRFGGLRVICVFVAGVAASGVVQADDSLAEFWKEQRNRARNTAIAVGTPDPAKTLVGLEFGTVRRQLLAKASPDECYTAIGGPQTAPPCAGDARLKVNQAYVWGMVDVGPDIWFGTVANTHCYVMSSLIGQALGGEFPPHETNSWVCEFGGAVYDPFGDQRPPELNVYHTTTGALEDKTADMDAAGLALLAEVVGLRAAGAADGVVLLAGPSLTGDVHVFAFADGGSYLGAAELPWSDIRRFAVLDGELYAGVGVPPAPPTPPGGLVLRWTGSTADPFSFETVTFLPGEQVAELTAHEGRLAAGTWPNPAVLAGLGETPGVWISPDPAAGAEPSDGWLDAGDGPWTKVWRVGDYEPDPANALVTGVGAMASFGGQLFWGTMHPPFLAAAGNFAFYSDFYSDAGAAGAAMEELVLAALLGTHRAISIWRGNELATAPEIEMLYGLPALPVFTEGPVGPDPPSAADYWSIVDTGWTPVWGISGFGNLFNNYTWSMVVNNDRLWVGTMDWLYLLQDIGVTALEAILASEGIDLEDLVADLLADETVPEVVAVLLAALTDGEDLITTTGADLYYFPFPDAPAFPESLGGLGNYTSYGIRNMRSVGNRVYAGMANPMNLLTDAGDDVPEGGWELLRLDDVAPNTPTGDEVTVTLADGSQVTLCDVQDPGYTVGVRLPLAGLPEFIPPPEGYLPSPDLVLVGTSANASTCGGGSLAGVCLPSAGIASRLFQLQLVDDPDLGPVPAWVDITMSFPQGLVCGEINPGAQDLLWELGYNGYLGIVTVLARADVSGIPDGSPLGRAALVLLMVIAALIIIRLRLG